MPETVFVPEVFIFQYLYLLLLSFSRHKESGIKKCVQTRLGPSQAIYSGN